MITDRNFRKNSSSDDENVVPIERGRRPRRPVDRLPLVRDIETGRIHRRDCPYIGGACAEFVGVESTTSADWCNCVVATLCDTLSKYFAAPAAATASVKNDLEQLATLLADFTAALEHEFARDCSGPKR